MEELQIGHYWIVIGENELVHARFDGNHFHHEKGKSHPEHVKVNRFDDVPPGGQCQTGCICTQNSDGSWHIVCP